jgi:tetratricopeptide (TPR) repeat protein/Zn-dependent protease
MGSQEGLYTALLVSFGWILSVCLHEFGHAIVAYWGGDTSVKDKGYLTLNPLKYIDPNTSITLPIIFLLLGGIALPGAAVYIQTDRLRGPIWRSAVSVAGPLATLLFALLLLVPFWIGGSQQSWVWFALAFLAQLEISAFLLNLIPIPSFDGFGIIEPWLPAQVQTQLEPLRRYGTLILFALLWFYAPANRAFWGTVDLIGEHLGLPVALAGAGYALFREWSTPLLLGTVVIAAIVRQVIAPHKVAFEAGNRLLQQGKLEKAIAQYDKAVTKKPDFHPAWIVRSYVLQSLGRYKDAEQSYTQAIALAPDQYGLYLNRGIVNALLNRQTEALADFDKALQLKPDSPETYTQRGCAYLEWKTYNPAIADFDKAIALDPNYAYAFNHRGLAHASQGDRIEGIQDITHALELEPGYAEAYLNRGQIRLELGARESARIDLNTAVQLFKQIRNKDALTLEQERQAQSLLGQLTA